MTRAQLARLAPGELTTRLIAVERVMLTVSPSTDAWRRASAERAQILAERARRDRAVFERFFPKNGPKR